MSFPTITKELAIQYTINWRKYYAHMYNATNGTQINYNNSKVFRGFRIPLESLQQMLQVINNYNNNQQNQNKINSIRAYIAKNSPNTNVDSDIHVVLLPVQGGRSMVPPVNPTITQFGTDIFNYEDAQGVNKSCIYNFTSPCPTECDTTSVLFAEVSNNP